MPKLQYIWLDWEKDAASDPIDRFIDLSQAASLVRVSICARPRRKTEYLHLKLPEVCTLIQLRLKGGFVISDVISSIACCASSVESLELDIYADDSAIQNAQGLTQLRLNRLRRIEVTDRFSFILVGTIEAPRLRSLAFRPGAVDLKSEHWTHYPHPLSDTQQFPALAHLFVPSDTTPEDMLIPYLVAHPKLKTVASVSLASAQRLLLTDNPESHTLLLPNLRNLTIYGKIIDPVEHTSALQGLVLRLQDISASLAGPKCRIHWRVHYSNPKSLAKEFTEYIHICNQSTDGYDEFKKLSG
jgi:hypothetical protein